jgi:hypothetical protein
MNSICPICKSDSDFLAYGVVAPWISILLNEKNEFLQTRLNQCKKCVINFYTYRYSDSQLEKIYQNYRSDEWYSLRHSWEPWYRRGTNNAYRGAKSERAVSKRKAFTLDLLASAGLDVNNLGDYLDFGGDAGQFFPDGVQGRRILFDLQKQQIAGIEVITDPKDLPELVQIVSNCYVLEHVSDIDLGIQLMSDCLEIGGHLLIELPYDIFRVSWIHKSKIYMRYLKLIYSNKFLFILIDFLSGLHRQLFNHIPWFGVVKQSEHLQYFVPRTVTELLESKDFEILFFSPPNRSSFVGFIKQGKFGIVAKKL